MTDWLSHHPELL